MTRIQKFLALLWGVSLLGSVGVILAWFFTQNYGWAFLPAAITALLVIWILGEWKREERWLKERYSFKAIMESTARIQLAIARDRLAQAKTPEELRMRQQEVYRRERDLRIADAQTSLAFLQHRLFWD